MPVSASNYFRYFSSGPAANAWGLALTASGFTRIEPGTTYPPVRHPSDHSFDWKNGRTLDALQLVLITTGSGLLETRAGRTHLRAGETFLVLPGLWHRYRPDPRTGWEESWIEVSGPLIDRLLKAQVFSSQASVRAGAMGAGLDAALEAVHTLARPAEMGFDPELAAAAYRVLTIWERMGRRVSPRITRLKQATMAAERYLNEHLTQPVQVAALARRLGVAYSHFRRAFKQHTGYAPWQYVLRLRLAHARRALATSDAALDEIAIRLGFSTAFHLSAAFKRAYGVSPGIWRREALGPTKEQSFAQTPMEEAPVISPKKLKSRSRSDC